MLSTLASTGNIFICAAGHVADEAHQERKKRPKICSKEGCDQSAEQVSFAAARLLFRRGWMANTRWQEERANKIANHVVEMMTEDPDYVVTDADLRIADKVPSEVSY